MSVAVTVGGDFFEDVGGLAGHSGYHDSLYICVAAIKIYSEFSDLDDMKIKFESQEFQLAT